MKKAILILLLFFTGCSQSSYPIYNDFITNQLGTLALTGRFSPSVGKQGINTGLYAIKNDQYRQMMYNARRF